MALRLPALLDANAPWGPPSTVPEDLKFDDVPYAPFSKGDKLGKVADWAAETKDGKDQKRTQFGKNFRDPYHAYGASSASFFTNEDAEELSSFSVVDNAKNANKPRGTATVLKTRGGAPRGGSFAGRGGSQRGGRFQNQPGRGPVGGQRGPNPRFGKSKFGWRDFDKPQRIRNASVDITDDWTEIQEITYSEMQKLSYDVAQGVEIDTYGDLFPYDRKFDRTNNITKLAHLGRTVFNTTTSEDPIMQELAKDPANRIFITDTILSQIMCTTKSVAPWDIVITKKGEQLFFDKREGGPLDFITVDENAADPPADSTDKDNINSSANLGFEATLINQNFASNAITEDPKSKVSYKANPFSNNDSNVLCHAYKYKKFNLSDDPEGAPLNLILRTEVDALGPDGTTLNLRVLNEYGSSEWKNKFNTGRGAIIAAELKHNLNKISRWTVQSILGDVDLMKIGFASRVSPKDNTQHNIIGVVSREPKQFAEQINVNLNNGWGIFKSVVNIATAKDDGKYVLVKDPNNPAVKIYKPAAGF